MKKIKSFFKSFWKQTSVFGLVLVLFIGLYVYHEIAYVSYKTITKTQLNNMIKEKKSFVVVIGSDSDSSSVSYKTVMHKWVQNHKLSKLYYLNVGTDSKYTSYLSDKLKLESVTIPQTVKYAKGKVTNQRVGSLSYYRLDEFIK